MLPPFFSCLQELNHPVFLPLQAIQNGVIELVMATLRSSSPVEWTDWRGPIGAQGGCLWRILCDPVLTIPPGYGPTELLELMIDSGAAEAAISVLKAFEVKGEHKVGEANVMTVTHALLMLQTLNLTAPEAQPIVALLREIPSALRFALEHNVNHLKAMGMTTGAICVMLCALVFGKEEDAGGFQFTQDSVDLALVTFKEYLSGTIWPFFPTLEPHFFRPVVHLCISDTNKALLVQSAGLLPLLHDALFLDSDHVRKDAASSMKAPIQADAVDCFLQIALFEPGRALLQQSGRTIDALRAIADGHGSWSEAASATAGRALIAIEGVSRPSATQAKAIQNDAGHAGRHVMCSYQWNAQRVITRFVRSLQRRGYRVSAAPPLVLLHVPRKAGSAFYPSELLC